MKIPGLKRFLRVDRGADGVRRSIDDELRFHFDMTVEQLVAGGMTPDDARAEAERRFGNVSDATRKLEHIDRKLAEHERRADLWDAARQDVRYALRGLRRTPGFTAVVVLTFALGIGANAAMFGVVDRLLLRAPALIVDPDRVVRIYFDRPGLGGTPTVNQHASYLNLSALRDQAGGFGDLAAYVASQRAYGTGATARQIRTLSASANFFTLLGVRPAFGRFYTPSEDVAPAGTPLAVLSYEFWQSEFGGDRGVLGLVVTLDDASYTVVGIAPRGFTGVDLDPVDVFLPLSSGSYHQFQDWNTANYMTWVSAIARLKPGVGVGAAQAEARRVLRGSDRNIPSFERKATVRLGPVPRALGPETGDARTRGRVAEWLSGVSLVLLLVACANVANLLVARAMRRRREIGVRLALGVGRARLNMSLVMESLVLALCGGLAGLVVASIGGRAMQTVLLPDTARDDQWFDPHVALVAAIAVAVTGLLTGVAPTLHVGHRDLVSALKANAHDGGANRSRLRAGLMVTQTALSVVLLVGAGLFVRSLRNIRTMDYGYDPTRLMFVSVDERPGLTRQQRLANWDRVLARAQALPGVEHASLSVTVPFWSTLIATVTVPGRDSIPQTASGRPYQNSVTPDYFAAMGTRLVAGRTFTTADIAQNARVVVINQTMAGVVWPNERALGKCLKIGRDTVPCSDVIGVVQDVKQHELRGESAMQLYTPISQAPGLMRVVAIRTAGDAAAHQESIRRALATAEPDVGFLTVRTLQERIEPSVRPWTLGATMFSIFGLLALATAAIGLYSVIAYGVTQRTHEFGVRAALGASEPSLIRLVLGDGVRVAVAGVVIGGGLALVATRWMGNLLFDVSSRDPIVYVSVVATLLGSALAASLIPAMRASRIDPAAALRAD